jgi:DNA-binding transcriptional MerR regulator/mannose-6-phosphate isomerase-like protein (cupin superfamily)
MMQMPPEPGPESVRNDGSLYHSIGDAAALTGVSRSLLRLWEREGLISPRRTAGGHRLYSSDDVARLRQIANLRRLDGLGVAGIRREIGVSAPTAANADLKATGRRLRAIRQARGLSLAAVAERTGISISFLSAVERGQSSMSVARLFKLADAYGTTVPAFGVDQPTEPQQILHPQERPRYVAGGGMVVMEDLIAPGSAIEAQHMVIAPGGGSEEAYAHAGEEFLYIISGTLSFWIDDGPAYQLNPGDALTFSSTRLHHWRNEGTEPVTLIWVNVPLAHQQDRSPNGRPAAMSWSPLPGQLDRNQRAGRPGEERKERS